MERQVRRGPWKNVWKVWALLISFHSRVRLTRFRDWNGCCWCWWFKPDSFISHPFHHYLWVSITCQTFPHLSLYFSRGPSFVKGSTVSFRPFHPRRHLSLFSYLSPLRPNNGNTLYLSRSEPVRSYPFAIVYRPLPPHPLFTNNRPTRELPLFISYPFFCLFFHASCFYTRRVRRGKSTFQ